MNQHNFLIHIEGKNRAEAEAKLKLMLQIGAFIKDFDVEDLLMAVGRYALVASVNNQTAEPKPRQTTTPPARSFADNYHRCFTKEKKIGEL